MTTHTITTLRRDLVRFFQAKDYTRAFDLIEKEYSSFPAHSQELSYWRICLHALLGKQEEALRIFQGVLDRGDWFPPKWLEEDPDLASLRPLPEFQRMIELCRGRLAVLQAEASPALLVRQPANSDEPLPLLIAQHGNGNNASNTVDNWARVTTEGWLLAVPQSSQMGGPDSFVWDDRATGVDEIREHLETLNSEYKIDAKRVVLGGFSTGGGQAVWMALHQAVRTRGFVVLSPSLRENELETLSTHLATHTPTGLRGAILVGEKDAECLAISRRIVELMRAHDLPCELEVRSSLDHRYPADFSAWVVKALKFIERGSTSGHLSG